MAEESDLEKTEPASERRLEQAREEGQVARSTELGTFAVALAGAAGLWLLGADLARELQSLMRGTLTFGRDQAFDPRMLLDVLYARAARGCSLFFPSA